MHGLSFNKRPNSSIMKPLSSAQTLLYYRILHPTALLMDSKPQSFLKKCTKFTKIYFCEHPVTLWINPFRGLPFHTSFQEGFSLCVLFLWEFLYVEPVYKKGMTWISHFHAGTQGLAVNAAFEKVISASCDGQDKILTKVWVLAVFEHPRAHLAAAPALKWAREKVPTF